MTPLKRFAAGAAVAALLASGAACTKDDPVVQPTAAPSTTSPAIASPTASATATATPTPTPTLSQRAQAEADAIAMVKKYYALSDKLATRPPTIAESKRQLSTVATSDQLAYSIVEIGRLHTAKQRQTGMVAVSTPRIESIDLTHKSKESPPKLPNVKVRICTDVSALELFDANGKSLSNPNRQMRRISHVELVNSSWPRRDTWRVRDILDDETKC